MKKFFKSAFAVIAAVSFFAIGSSFISGTDMVQANGLNNDKYVSKDPTTYKSGGLKISLGGASYKHEDNLTNNGGYTQGVGGDPVKGTHQTQQPKSVHHKKHNKRHATKKHAKKHSKKRHRR